MDINEMVRKAYTDAQDKQLWSGLNEVGTGIALIHAELSEALEADRRGHRERLSEELADVCILLGSLCGWLDIDLEAEVKKKMELNKARPPLHGKKY
jgi:NTP pyrophosphatase (non-canonical NTP hydrolase)